MGFASTEFKNSEKNLLSLHAAYSFRRLNGVIHIVSNNGIIVDVDEVTELVGELNKFIEVANQTEILKHNKEMFERWNNEGRTQKESTKKSKRKDGFVYLIKADNGLYKIGRTKNKDLRMGQLRIQLPYGFSEVLSIKTNDCVTLEKRIHIDFKDKRKQGEWFELKDSDVMALRGQFGEVFNFEDEDVEEL